MTEETKMEPNDFFELMKSKITEKEKSEITQGLKFLEEQYAKARNLKQETLYRRISLAHDVLTRECVLIGLGLNRCISREAVIEYIDKVTPKDSVKAVELSAYPRVIPNSNAEKIKKFVDLGIFDEIIILYTDFTNTKAKTQEQQAMIARNRDPIAFGIFYNASLDFQHERMYVITDWIDDHCDLTFNKLVTNLGSMGVDLEKSGGTTLQMGDEAINKLMAKDRAEIEKADIRNMAKKPVSFISKIVSFIKG